MLLIGFFSVPKLLALRVERDSASGILSRSSSGMITLSDLAAEAAEDFEEDDLEWREWLCDGLENASLASLSSYFARIEDKLVLGILLCVLESKP